MRTRRTRRGSARRLLRLPVELLGSCQVDEGRIPLTADPRSPGRPRSRPCRLPLTSRNGWRSGGSRGRGLVNKRATK
ncbi:hypothetical protein PF010_g22141 [Phytophthora fragariae]|uniref:Uncharacterized protein n=2 Tax=Phytophthora fragariae TaxID=53985 RepID=A0A6A4BXG1_9STRA|nr:hypothetical protein PF003_g26324 [Phytophthora fragariae]KAE8924356.1 hypothetical protein PF009_g25412 [Phytophthora fragariae]KAE9081050.1 hypothetical protein PF010_g22141 [Phytophthora fragariae]KAE9082580.1 hypothetical protein PF007_g22243 [Phytophthora fragariae]KAE9094928.1 hypothetical protein PF006_g24109 [Phytophthora fragariae]